MADVPLLASQAADAPLGYQVPGAQEIIIKSITASYDGTGAAGTFVPTLQVLAPNGAVLASCPVGNAVAAGASVDVSWFPRGGLGTAGGDIRFDFDNIGDWLSVQTTGLGGVFNTGIGLEATDGGIQIQSDNTVSGNGFLQLNSLGDGNGGLNLDADGTNGGGVNLNSRGAGDGGIQLDARGASSGGIGITSHSAGEINVVQQGGDDLTVVGKGAGVTRLASEGAGELLLDTLNGAGTALLQLQSGAGGILIGASNGGFLTAGGNIVIISGDDAPMAGTVATVQIRINPHSAFTVIDGAASTTYFQADSSGHIHMPGLPLAAAGLGAGELWNNGGVVNIV